MNVLGRRCEPELEAVVENDGFVKNAIRSRAHEAPPDFTVFHVNRSPQCCGEGGVGGKVCFEVFTDRFANRRDGLTIERKDVVFNPVVEEMNAIQRYKCPRMSIATTSDNLV